MGNIAALLTQHACRVVGGGNGRRSQIQEWASELRGGMPRPNFATESADHPRRVATHLLPLVVGKGRRSVRDYEATVGAPCCSPNTALTCG